MAGNALTSSMAAGPGAGTNQANGGVNGSPSIAGATAPQPDLSIDRKPQGARQKGEAPTSPLQGVHDNFNQAQASYKQGMKAQQVLDHVRQELDDLMEMGDAIRPEDVIASAGTLVGKGLGAQQLAELLSSMPTMGGQGLASWIRMHDVTVRNTEAQMAQENALAAHNMAVAGFRSLAAHKAEGLMKERSGIMRDAANLRSGAMGPLGPQAGGPPMQGGGGESPVSVVQMQQPPASAGSLGEGIS